MSDRSFHHGPGVPHAAYPLTASAVSVSSDEVPGLDFEFDDPTVTLIHTDERQLFAKLSEMLHGPLRRVYAWRVPPHWSKRDWFEEMRALGVTAAWEAWRDYDPSRGVPLSAFIYLRVVAGALTRYRQEWGYALHCLRPADGEKREHVSTTGDSSCHPMGLELLRCALAQLSDSGQRLVEQLFWQGDTETEVARRLGISHQAVSKRKRVLLRDLRECLGVDGEN